MFARRQNRLSVVFQFDCHLDTLWNIQEESFFEQLLVKLACSDACAVLFWFH